MTLKCMSKKTIRSQVRLPVKMIIRHLRVYSKYNLWPKLCFEMNVQVQFGICCIWKLFQEVQFKEVHGV